MFFTLLLIISSSLACETCRRRFSHLPYAGRPLSYLYDAADLENLLPPAYGHGIEKLIYYDADDVDDKLKLGKFFKTASKIAKIGAALDFSADDLENKFNWSSIVKIAGHVNRVGQVLGFDAEDLENGYALFPNRKLVLDRIVNSVQLQQMQRSDEQRRLGSTPHLFSADSLKENAIEMEVKRLDKKITALKRVMNGETESKSHGMPSFLHIA